MKKGLTPEDKALWDLINQGVQPLKKSQRVLPTLKSTSPSFIKQIPEVPPLSSSTSHYQLAKIEYRDIKNITIEARLDLHGYTILQAEKILSRFIGESQHLGRRWVLVITGKGLHSNKGVEKGTLKKFTHDWLLNNPHLIISFVEAKPQHGGSGAVYIKLRRIRPLYS